MTTPSASSDALTISKATLRRLGLALAGLLVLTLAIVVIVALVRGTQGSDSLASGINSSEYQAVALTNNTVYFGKLSAPGGDFYYLRHVCYLTAQQSQRGKSAAVLRKLITDINTPEDLLIIGKSQIRFVENLNPSGQAAQILAHNSCRS
jgi:hypothetical protein